MAETKATRVDGPFYSMNRVVLVEWVLDAATSANAEWFNFSMWTDLTVQLAAVISGTPTVTFQGSLDTDPTGTVAAGALSDNVGSPISLSTAGDLAWVIEAPWLARPQVSGGEARVRIKGNIGGTPGH